MFVTSVLLLPVLVADCSVPYPPLGMQNGNILDGQITASSQTVGFESFNARLYGSSCWKSAKNNSGEFLQINLGEKKYVKAVKMQGDPQGDNWTEQFYMAYSLGSVWKNVTWLYDGVKVCQTTLPFAISALLRVCRLLGSYSQKLLRIKSNSLSLQC